MNAIIKRIDYICFISRRPDKIMTINGKSCINMASLNFLGLMGDETIEVSLLQSFCQTRNCVNKSV